MAKDSLDDALDDAVDKATGMVDMKRTAAEIKKDSGPVCSTDESEGPKYPWGLEVRLESEALEKLGIEKLPRVGDRLQITAVAVVESVREEEQMRGGKKTKPRRDVSLQIQKMAVNSAKKR